MINLYKANLEIQWVNLEEQWLPYTGTTIIFIVEDEIFIFYVKSDTSTLPTVEDERYEFCVKSEDSITNVIDEMYVFEVRNESGN